MRSRALRAVLALPGVPRRIECFDISTIQGSETVASMVVCEDGRMRKGEYRKFRFAALRRSARRSALATPALTGLVDVAPRVLPTARRERRARESRTTSPRCTKSSCGATVESSRPVVHSRISY